jgi:low temperature requirement protein LtrA
VRAAVIVAMTAMLVVALAIPEAWHDLPGGLNAPLALACSIVVVRFGHLVVHLVAAGDDAGLRAQLVRTAVPVVMAGVPLVTGAVVEPSARTWWWAAALAVDHVGVGVVVVVDAAAVTGPGHLSITPANGRTDAQTCS